jgi:hypothetical protein
MNREKVLELWIYCLNLKVIRLSFAFQVGLLSVQNNLKPI